MNEQVYYLTDDSCEPLDPTALSIESMSKSEWFDKYGHCDWTFESYQDAVRFMLEGFKDE